MIGELNSLVTFILASTAIVIVPGPSVTVIVANSLKSGIKAGLINIAGTQFGLAILVILLALGLDALTTTMAWIFDWVRLAGAAYLIWLGYKLFRSKGELEQISNQISSDESYFWQGLVVVLSNPKVLVFFGAFLPQFVDPSGDTALQIIILGLIFMAVATLFDSAYAFAAGRAGSLLTKSNVRKVEIGAGGLMVSGGIWLIASRN